MPPPLVYNLQDNIEEVGTGFIVRHVVNTDYRKYEFRNKSVENRSNFKKIEKEGVAQMQSDHDDFLSLPFPLKKYNYAKNSVCISEFILLALLFSCFCRSETL
jgi:hypothetical protein